MLMKTKGFSEAAPRHWWSMRSSGSYVKELLPERIAVIRFTPSSAIILASAGMLSISSRTCSSSRAELAAATSVKAV